MAYKTKYKINNEEKYIGNPSNIICRSLWERRVCKYLDENMNVLKWGSEELPIPYYSPIDKKNHKYFPDFIAKIKNKNGNTKTVIIEVKPKKQTQPPKKPKRKTKNYINECVIYTINEAKWNAANKFCKTRAWSFIILTEDDILI
ncbi:head completion protein [Candidatus Woesearchaeota archaeon]|jgi:hypothetical protein|nr:head completion protein [Candidatus Woesearchaeota archaeon]